MRHARVWWTVAVCGLAAAAMQATAAEGAGEADTVTLTVAGKTFAVYRTVDPRFPCFFPVFESHGIPMTRQWPLVEDAVDEAKDHPHHRSMWFTHGNVNGLDFWSQKEGATIASASVDEQRRDGDAFLLRTQSRWIEKSGKVVCTDRRLYRAHPGPAGILLDAEIEIRAGAGEVVFGDTKEGSFAIRVPGGLSLNGSKGASHIVTSTGRRDKEAWGVTAPWCDYSGTLSNRTLGVAILDHPANPRPARWHVREYGLFCANPFGAKAFDPKEPEATFKIEAGQAATFRYRMYFHDGDTTSAKLDDCLRDFAATGDRKQTRSAQ